DGTNDPVEVLGDDRVLGVFDDCGETALRDGLMLAVHYDPRLEARSDAPGATPLPRPLAGTPGIAAAPVRPHRPLTISRRTAGGRSRSSTPSAAAARATRRSRQGRPASGRTRPVCRAWPGASGAG